MNVSTVEKVILEYLKHNHVHTGFKVKEIKNETISTYDGQYPSFEIIYEGKQPKHHMSPLEITSGIEKYTGLKRNKDYWIGISWEE